MTDDEVTGHAVAAVLSALHSYEAVGASPIEASRHLLVTGIAMMLLATDGSSEAKLEELLGLMGHIEGLAAELEAPPQGTRLN